MLRTVLCEVEFLLTCPKEWEQLSISEQQVKQNLLDEGRRLFLQGQFRYLDDWDAIIFLCNPMCVQVYLN